MNKINLLPKVKNVKAEVKRSLATAAAGATIFAFSAVPLLSHSFTVEFFSTGSKVVDLSIESINKKTGDFTGEALGEDGDIWEVVGTVSGNKMEMEMTNLTEKGRIVASGEIQDDGSVAGKAATEDGELLEWEATDALVTKGAV